MIRAVTTVLLLSLTTPALAVDFNTQLTGADGKPITECIRLNDERTKCIEEVNLTLGWLARFALDQSEEADPRSGARPQIAVSEIIKRGNLAEKIKANDKLDLSVDEAKLIKDQIIKLSYKVGIKYQAIKIIDPRGIEDGK